LYCKNIRLLVVGAGVLLLLAAGIVTVSATPPSQEGEPPNLGAEYVGTGFCTMCHKQDETWDASGHVQMVRPASEETILGDLTDTAAVTFTWPDGSERPLTAEDITYVLGGRYMQRYVSLIPRADGSTGYYVLPVQWNVPQTADQPGMWTPFHAEDWQDPARDWRVACAGCHTTGLDGATAAEETAFAFAEEWDKGQVELNIGCEACHGPGSAHLGDQGTLVRSPDAQICGQCHVQGQDPGGEHGYPVGYQPGLALDESLFVPAPQTDESVWWPDGHARVYNQYGEWLESAHALTRAMGEVCVRCHATASATDDQTLANATDGITCAACHDVHASGLRLPAADTAVAPDGETPLSYTLCVTCHNSRTPDGSPLVMGGGLHHPAQEMFEGWDMVETVPGIPSTHYSADAGPRCTTCHMPLTVQIGEYGRVASHTMAPVMPAAEIEPDSCSGCHGELVTRPALQQFIDSAQAGTEARIDALKQGMGNDAPDWISTAVSFVDGDGSRGVHNPAYTDALLTAAEIELGIRPVVEPELSPEELGFEPDLAVEEAEEKETNVAEGGLTTPSIVLLAIVGLVLAVAAYAFFVREAEYE
jgi:hypothetical protein